jgi:hypothetical protein
VRSLRRPHPALLAPSRRYAPNVRAARPEALLFRLAEAAIARPDDTVCAVVYPVAGEKTLRDLVAEWSPFLSDSVMALGSE